MNFNLKHVAAAVALTVSAPSFAAISTDSFGGGGGVLTGDGSGELFFVAFDSTRSETFILDLNLTASNFINNNASLINNF